MTTGGTPTGDGSPNDPYGSGSQGFGYQGQEPYPGQGYGQTYGQQGQEPYPGQGYDQSGQQQFYAGQPGVGGAVPPGKLSATDAISAGWQLFKNNPVPWILFALAMLLASVVTGVISGSDSAGLSFIGNILNIAVSFVFSAFLIRGALLEIDGHKPEIGDFFKLHNFGWFVLASIIVGIATTIGMFLLIIPGILILFFTYWTNFFVIDRNMTAMDAIKSSFNAIKTDGGNLFVLAILNVLIVIVGALVLLVGLLVAMPVATLASAVAYRAITGPSDFSRAATSTV